jgi:hypothetical protein
VKNIEKAIVMLGSTKKIATANDDKPLELKFRPCDNLCRPCFGTHSSFHGLLLKVVVKRRKKKTAQFEEFHNSSGIKDILQGFMNIIYLLVF